MPSDRAPKSTVHDGFALGEPSPGHAEFNELMVSSRCHGHGRLLPLDGLSICDLGNRSSCEALICGVDHLFAGNAGSARFRTIVMEQDFRKKNRRLLIAFIVFAVGFTLLIILWKLSIYQK